MEMVLIAVCYRYLNGGSFRIFPDQSARAFERLKDIGGVQSIAFSCALGMSQTTKGY